jgi:outer membrane receptor for ferrienterochelin and colicins
MKKIALSILTILCVNMAYSQYTYKAIVLDSSKQPLAGASLKVKNKTIGATASKDGRIELANLQACKYEFEISFKGYKSAFVSAEFPNNDTATQIIYLTEAADEEEEDLEEVVVSSTRTSRTIANTPTRVETIELEEIDEKSNMRPSNVSMILHESTGMQVQQTSATSGNASIRIQGLDGRYTQLLKDGFASFGNFASGLSILEIPPLDLKQVEIIKGPASTLYGGGAIAGVINFISKTPKEKAQYNFLFNQSNLGATNIGGYAMQRGKKVGYSLLALYNYQKAFDVDKDDFSELAKGNDFTIHPKLFLYPTEKATIVIGNSFSKAERIGGDLFVIKNKADAFHTFFEKNNTVRNTTTIEWNQKFSETKKLIAKASLAYFDRSIALSGYLFKGQNLNMFTDIAYSINKQNQTFIVGGNFISDNFKEKAASTTGPRNFTTNTAGSFVQHTWDINSKAKLESGLRADYVNYSNNLFSKAEFFVLPRVSLLYKFNNEWSSRVGAGLGYKTPTLFTELTETLQYQNITALNNVKAERSIGGTFDVNFKKKIAPELNFSLNQMFFYTNINNALVLQNGFPYYFFANAKKAVVSAGFETNAKFIFKENYKLFAGYTFTDASAKYITGNQFLTLLPKHKVNLALIYELEDKYKFGLEGYYTGNQYLSSGIKTPSFWEFGFMAEKIFKRFSVYINFENFSDQRQSNYKTVSNPPHSNPSFDEIWNHVEGFSINGGIKLKF